MTMTRIRPNSFRKLVTAIALAVMLLPGAAIAGKKKQAPEPTSGPKKPDYVYFDIGKIVWPNPPAVARIRFVNLFTGEKVDWSKYDKSNRKQKQKWMDRLAGTKPDNQVDAKDIPYQLVRTYGVAIDSKGQIYAADQSVGAIFIFNPETKAVEMIRNGKEAHLPMMVGLAVDDSDRLYVTDDKLREVLIFDAKHQPVAGFGADVIGRPGGIAIDNENRFLYVVDTENDVVDVFDADTFKFLRKIGTPGKKHTLTDPGTFSLPTFVAVDKDGNVYVTDTLNARVEIFDADGQFISTFGKRGDAPADFIRPKGIAVDGDGHIWVVDSGQNRVKVFDRDGQLLIYIGGLGNYPGQFMEPYAIAIDKNNRVVTSEQAPGRVQMFRYVSDSEADDIRKEMAKAGKTTAAPDEKTSATAEVKNSAAEAKDGANAQKQPR